LVLDCHVENNPYQEDSSQHNWIDPWESNQIENEVCCPVLTTPSPQLTNEKGYFQNFDNQTGEKKKQLTLSRFFNC